MSLPNRIRELRKAQRPRGWTLQKLAGKLNCSITQLADLEKCNRELSYSWMIRIAAALKVTPADLLLPEHNSGALTPDERGLVERYRAGDQTQRLQVSQMMEIIVPDIAAWPWSH